MTNSPDTFETLRDCRAVFVERLTLLLRGCTELSSSAIQAITQGAGVYFDGVVASSRRSSFREEVDGLTSSRITLVGEDDLELELRLDELRARLFDAAGTDLWKNHLYFVSVLKRPDLSKSDNPVGPNAIIDGLEAMFAAAGMVVIDKKLDLLDAIEAKLLLDLPNLYAAINEFFSGHGVELAASAIVSSPDASKKMLPGATTNGDGSLQALQQALMARMSNVAAFGSGGEVGGGAAGGGAVASLLSQATLERLIFRLDELDRRGSYAPTFSTSGSPPLENLIPGLFEANGTGVPVPPKSLSSAELGVPPMAPEALAIDTLAMIFETIFEHPTLPDALKAIISSLQITMLKLAMQDAAFFADANHPARRLIDRMGLAMMGLPVDVSARHPICKQLFEITGHLRSKFTGDLAVFDEALVELDALISSQQANMAGVVASYLPLINQLDRRDQASVASRRAIEQLTALGVPEKIKEFLQITWQDFLQMVWQESGAESDAWKASIKVIEELLWTFQPKLAAEDRKSLARRLPEMLKLLKKGMECVGMSAEAQAAFLDASFALQTQALRSTALAVPNTEPVADMFDGSGISQPLGEPVAGEVRVGNLLLTTLDFANSQPSPSRSMSCQPGEWLALKCADAKTHVMQLCYLSPISQRALFFSPEEGLALAIHSAILDQQFKLGQARICSVSSLFDSAAERALHRTKNT